MPAPSIPTGNITLFCQAAAPVNWTKLTTYDDYALRVVSGTATVAGSSPFTTCYTDRGVSASVTYSVTLGSYTLSSTEIASHSHSPGGGVASSSSANLAGGAGATALRGIGGATTVAPAGGGGAHSHTYTASAPAAVSFPGTLTLGIQYVDVIQCSRN